MTDVIKVFIGYDHNEEIAYHTLASSIIRQSSMPVTISPINLGHFRRFFHREPDPQQSTEFSFSRFLTPYLCGYEGWAIFMDCDMIVKCDLADVWMQRDSRYSVMVCKHDYSPKHGTKFLGNVQHAYPRKNWSSFMLMNCGECKTLTPQYVEKATGLELHRFLWTKDDKIGELPLGYNWLVGEYPKSHEARVLHYTVGGPYFNEYQDCDYADDWFREYEYMNHVKQSTDGSETDDSQSGDGEEGSEGLD